MQSMASLSRNFKPKSNIVEQKLDLYCDECKRKYDYYKFENGQEFKHGCDCSMIRAAEATVNNYQPQNESQDNAKQTAIEYVKTFSVDNPKSLILQGSYGTGKSHLAYAIAKAVKAQGYTVAFMHIPKLMDRIKATYNKDAVETTDELVKLLSELDLLVLDDMGVENTEHTLNKLFSIVDNRSGMNNIFTTNYSDKELKQNQNWQRINSRMKMNARKTKVLGEDYRERDAW